MTEQEAREFVDKVKGKKIRASIWEAGSYFIPDGNISDQFHDIAFFGTLYCSDGLVGYTTMGIGKGFEDYGGSCWSFYNEEDEPLIKKTKICECGKEKHGFANHSDWCPLYQRDDF